MGEHPSALDPEADSRTYVGQRELLEFSKSALEFVGEFIELERELIDMDFKLDPGFDLDELRLINRLPTTHPNIGGRDLPFGGFKSTPKPKLNRFWKILRRIL